MADNKSGKVKRIEKTISGSLSVHRDGYGFVTPVSGGEDIFIPARYLRENLHGDRVEIILQGESPRGKREGRIVRTTERGVKHVTGIFSWSQRGGTVKPDDERLPSILIPASSSGSAKDGEVVVAELTSYPEDRKPPFGKVIEVLGSPDDPEVEVLTIIRKFELPSEFPEAVLKYAKGVPESLSDNDLQGRRDLRKSQTVTIDGETARDFDDAVSIRKEGNNFRLWVSIADVAHYVSPGSPIDREAYLRGTSVYFPDRCIPMLPEELSNGICSLNPDVDRLTMTAEMLFDADGEMLDSSFYPSVIRSSARLTYTVVSRIIEHDDSEAKAAHKELVGDLMLMKELSISLAEMRSERGSIDFDLPEADIIIGNGGVTESIIRSERNLAHKLIESFMLAANEAVATHLTESDIPTLYRIHELPDPDKLMALSEFLRPLGYDLPAGETAIKPGDIKRLLAEAIGKPEERLVNRMLLRSMKQARYAAENFGHFGLAAPCYTHFTSPIRRYPDLVVHRLLKWLLQQKSEAGSRGKLKGLPFPGFPAALAEIGEHTSKRERVAMEAERDIVELKKVQFMVGKIGKEFAGVVSGVSGFGFFVELDDLFVEGLVHVSTLEQDFYRFVEAEQTLVGERTGARYRIGDTVRVVVAAASPERRQIEFTLAGVVPSVRTEGEQYKKVPVKGKKPEGWKAGGSRPGDSGGDRPIRGGKAPRRDGGGRGGRKRH
jgi:ribonuclease R